jgi:hypothetical protein
MSAANVIMRKHEQHCTGIGYSRCLTQTQLGEGECPSNTFYTYKQLYNVWITAFHFFIKNGITSNVHKAYYRKYEFK